MSGVLRVRHAVGGLLIMAMGNLLSGCDKAPDQSSEGGLDAIPGEPKVQVQKSVLSPEDIPTSVAETPPDAGAASPDPVSETTGESAAAQAAPPESRQPTVEELKHALLERGWREVPDEDGSVFLMPPESTP